MHALLAMIGWILLLAVAAVGLLGICAMIAVARKALRRQRQRHAQIRARAVYEQNRERNESELAAQHARSAARRAEVVAAAVASPSRAHDLEPGELTGVIALLDQSAPFATTVAPATPPPTLRRAAKGSVPHPIRDTGRTLPTNAIVNHSPTLPPPIPPRRVVGR